MAAMAVTAARAAAPGTVSAKIAFTTGGIVGSACPGGFDATGGIGLRFAASDPRVDGQVPDGRLTEVASATDEAYVAARGHLHAHGRTSPVALTAVDHGDFLDGVYRSALAHHAGVFVGNTSSHQDDALGGHGAFGRVGDIAPHKNAVLVTAACAAAGARATGQPPATPGGPPDVRAVHGTIETTLSHVHTRRCSAGKRTTATARTVLRGSDPLASGVLTLDLVSRSNRRGASVVSGAGVLRRAHKRAVVGSASFLGARRKGHTDGVFTIHLAHRRGFLALNAATAQRSATRSHGGFGRSGPVAPRNTAVIVPAGC